MGRTAAGTSPNNGKSASGFENKLSDLFKIYGTLSLFCASSSIQQLISSYETPRDAEMAKTWPQFLTGF